MMQHYPQVQMPERANVGETIEIKTLLTIPETPKDQINVQEKALEMNIFIQKFTAEFEGETVFQAELTEDFARHTYLSFHMKVRKSGTLKLIWKENSGKEFSVSRKLQAT